LGPSHARRGLLTHSCYVAAIKEDRAYSRTCASCPSILLCATLTLDTRGAGLAPLGGVCLMVGWLSLAL
jgi:hypothetical protein